MKKEAFELLREMERSWWYRGRAFAIRAVLARARVAVPVESILDFGAGYGGMYAELVRFGRQIYAFEPDADARAGAARRGYASVYGTAENALSEPYDLIGLFDVIEHIEDDESFLRSLDKALAPGGQLVITVPAFKFLWSEHDVTHRHFRRYDRRSLSGVLSRAGYEVVVMSYWNMLLFIPAAVMRLLGHSGSSALGLSSVIDSFLRGIVAVESKMARFFALPFGVSLVAVARKK
ncbi:MAG: class I SAM-dependent methyltransferase [Candidatus Paceibacterota bacterium]|jgi:SAM-dependent methyltransferase